MIIGPDVMFHAQLSYRIFIWQLHVQSIAELPYPHNVATTEALTGKAKITEDFAQAFADVQTIIVLHPYKG